MNGKLIHYVLFWLDRNLDENEIRDFTGFFEELKKVPTVKQLQYGRAASTEQRDVVDNSFTYALLVSFDSREDHDVYQKHEYHLKAVEKYSKFWTRVVVHDTVITG